jgi:hypothetical protein
MQQCNDLYRILIKYPKLFNGKLKTYPHKTFHLKLKPDAKPFHSKAYQVPRIHLPTFKKELQQLQEEGVLYKVGATAWAAGTFIIPKANGTVRWVSDFCKLNEAIDRDKYPLPKIQQVVQNQ